MAFWGIILYSTGGDCRLFCCGRVLELPKRADIKYALNLCHLTFAPYGNAAAEGSKMWVLFHDKLKNYLQTQIFMVL